VSVSAEERLVELEARLQRLEDERAITDTLYRYLHTIDNGPREAFLDCFTIDAVLVWPPPHEPYRGHEQIGEVAYDGGEPRPPVQVTKHTLIAPRIELDGDRASVRSYYATLLDDPAGGPRIMSIGTYTDVLVRCADGRWRFAHRTNTRESRRPIPPELSRARPHDSP
jgi:ketosteroid isomerase-like protein